MEKVFLIFILLASFRTISSSGKYLEDSEQILRQILKPPCRVNVISDEKNQVFFLKHFRDCFTKIRTNFNSFENDENYIFLIVCIESLQQIELINKEITENQKFGIFGNIFFVGQNFLLDLIKPSSINSRIFRLQNNSIFETFSINESLFHRKISIKDLEKDISFRRADLAGIELNILVEEEQPSVILDGRIYENVQDNPGETYIINRNFVKGIFPVILDLFKEDLNFSYVLHKRKDGVYGNAYEDKVKINFER